MALITCISCGYDLSAHATWAKPGVLCPECGNRDAARRRGFHPTWVHKGPWVVAWIVWGVVQLRWFWGDLHPGKYGWFMVFAAVPLALLLAVPVTLLPAWITYNIGLFRSADRNAPASWIWKQAGIMFLVGGVGGGLMHVVVVFLRHS